MISNTHHFFFIYHLSRLLCVQIVCGAEKENHGEGQGQNDLKVETVLPIAQFYELSRANVTKQNSKAGWEEQHAHPGGLSLFSASESVRPHGIVNADEHLEEACKESTH